ncbi:MAG: TIGR03086 family metal-binding protein [Actinomycetota bacterium]|nr:TIGR03086 family metal-binding protein [Actinomycetota bacterium]
MHSEDRTLALLERALDQTAGILALIRPEQESLPTPCPEWDVEALITHLTMSDLPHFTTGARGEAVDWRTPPGELGEDWLQEFRDGVRLLSRIWAEADLDQLVPSMGGKPAPLRARADQQIAELAMHSWDLAKATGQAPVLDNEVAEHALGWSRQMLRPEFRGPGKAFGVEVPVPEDAPSYERLAGWFGRDPHWTPDGGAPGSARP